MADFNEVKAIGSLNSSTRTAAQSHIAAFWNTNPARELQRHCPQVRRPVLARSSDSARLLALMDLTAADALITTWADKYYYNFAAAAAIRQADTDGNPDTLLDPNWEPMFHPTLDPAIGGVGPSLITPPYPDHLSGATSYASASMNALAAFFGTDEPLLCDEQPFSREQRAFTRFSDVTNEVLEARIYAGIHFRNPDVQSADLATRSCGMPRPTGSPRRTEPQAWSCLRAAPRLARPGCSA